MKIFISSIIFNIPFMFPDPEDLRKELGEKICIAINNSDKFIKKYNKANLAFIIAFR
ncbi:MAG: hypothetical protein IPJ74_11335 [Saprospiraceae bacterium]|nr:hypothetical protein [Saprospiraceae bacterium]